MPIIDTSVIIEMINSAGTCHLQANIIKRQLELGNIIAHLPMPNLSEIYYIALRIYSQLNQDIQKAKKLILWLVSHNHIKIQALTMDLIFLSGEIKNQYTISIMDSFNFALAKVLGEKLIFKSKEREFPPDLLKDFHIIFLDQFINS